MGEGFKNIIVVLITILLCLLMFEGFLRVANPHYLNPVEIEGQIYESDTILGIKTIPNSQSTILYYDCSHTPEDFIVYNINSKGLRDDEYEYKKPNNITRIILLGDSMIFGAEVNRTYTIDYYLDNLLLNTQVINLGISSFGTVQEYLYLKSEGIKYNPDLVITFVYVNNDGYDNIGLSPRGASHLKVRPILVNGTIEYGGYTEKSTARFSLLKDYLRKNTYTYAMLSKVYHQKIKLNIGVFGNEYIDYNATFNKQINSTVTALKMIDDFCEDKNIKHLVVIIPSGTIVNEQYVEWKGEKSKNYDYNFKHTIVKDMREHNISCYDLTPYLRENSIYNHDTLYFNNKNNPGHFTPYGNKLVAEKIAEISTEMI